MNDRFNDPHELNTPSEMLARAAFVLMLAGFAIGTVMCVGGLVSQEVRLAAAGVVAWAASFCLRRWLVRSGQFQAAKASCDALGDPVGKVDESRVAELTELLRQWEALERKRGTPEFDPWALQSLRHDIRELVANDAALAALYHEFRQRHAA